MAEDTAPQKTADAIRCSIVVPSFNRSVQLRRCLGALVAQDEAAFEIVVVDDGSAEPLAPVCEEFGGRVRFIRQDKAGPAATRNRGAAESKGAFLAFTDDDCLPRSDWLRRLFEIHGGVDNRLVGGRVENGLPGDPYASASQALCDYLYDYFGAEAGTMPFFTSNNIGCSRAGFDRVGGFDETFPMAAAEDRDFGLRWHDADGELRYCEDAVIDHFHAMTFARFLHQHANYGRGAYHLHTVLDQRGAELPKREPLAFYRDLLLWPVRRRGLRGIGQAALMIATQAAMVAGYARAARAARFLE